MAAIFWTLVALVLLAPLPLASVYMWSWTLKACTTGLLLAKSSGLVPIPGRFADTVRTRDKMSVIGADLAQEIAHDFLIKSWVNGVAGARNQLKLNPIFVIVNAWVFQRNWMQWAAQT